MERSYSAKAEQLTRDCSAPFGGLFNLRQPSSYFLCDVWRGEQEVGVPKDHRHQIIEIVGDSSCKASNAFHFLLLTELRFMLSLLGDILAEACRAGHLAAN